MISIRCGIKGSGPGLIISIWKFVFRIHINKRHFLINFIKTVFSDIAEGVIPDGQVASYNIIHIHCTGSKVQLLFEIQLFSLNVSFGLADIEYQKPFKLEICK